MNAQTLSKSPYEPIYAQDVLASARLTKVALVDRLPFALDYAASLQLRDHAVLFYDNLVVAAEYLCAFIEEGIRRQETTCFTGLEPERYRGLFEQVGINTRELENCGFLRNLSSEQFYNESEGSHWNGVKTAFDRNPHRARFIHIQSPTTVHEDDVFRCLMKNEQRTHNLSLLPTTSICCYDAKLVLMDAPRDVFTGLLKTHNHCFFQGIAMETSKLIGLQRNNDKPVRND